MEVNLSPEQAAFIEQIVRAGRFASADEAIREALGLLEEHERDLEEIRAGVDEGDRDYAEGRFTEYTDETLPQLFEEIRREGRALLEKRQAVLTRE